MEYLQGLAALEYLHETQIYQSYQDEGLILHSYFIRLCEKTTLEGWVCSTLPVILV